MNPRFAPAKSFFLEPKEIKMSRLVSFSFLAFLASALVGCGQPAPPPVASGESQIKQIVARSGGKWESLSQADRDALVTQLGHGNETTAKMSFSMRWSSDQAMKGGPKGPGAP